VKTWRVEWCPPASGFNTLVWNGVREVKIETGGLVKLKLATGKQEE